MKPLMLMLLLGSLSSVYAGSEPSMNPDDYLENQSKPENEVSMVCALRKGAPGESDVAGDQSGGSSNLL